MTAYIITLKNPNVNSDQDQVLYLLTDPDDRKNKLLLSFQNTSGAAVTFTKDKRIELALGALPVVLEKIEVDAADWSVQPYVLANGMRGLYLVPAAEKPLENGAILTLTLTNIVFPGSYAPPKSESYEFKVSYKGPPREGYSTDFLVKRWADAPNELFNFEAAFVAVPTSKGWNVKVGNTPEYIADKPDAAVYANCNPDRPITTRLAFRLTNQDRMYPLVLTASTSFEVRFLADEDGNALANEDALAGIDISPIGAGDWDVVKAKSAGITVWTLRPRGKIMIPARGGSYQFLIDGVLPNGFPADNKGGPVITEMYVFYANVPHRQGDGLYEDGYLATTVVKRALEPRVPRIWVTPADNGQPREINKPITVNWCALGVETVTITYIDQDGKPQKKERQSWQGSMQVTPPAYPPVRRTTTYACESEGGKAGCAVTMQSLFDKRCPKRQFALVYAPRLAAADQAEAPHERSSTLPIFMFDLKGAVVTIGDDGRADLKLTCRDQPIHASGNWWSMVSDGGDFAITFSFTLDANSRKIPYGSTASVTLPASTAFTLQGKCTGHDLTLGDVIVTNDSFWVARLTNNKDNSVVGDYYEVFCRAGDKWKLS